MRELRVSVTKQAGIPGSVFKTLCFLGYAGGRQKGKAADAQPRFAGRTQSSALTKRCIL